VECIVRATTPYKPDDKNWKIQSEQQRDGNHSTSLLDEVNRSDAAHSSNEWRDVTCKPGRLVGNSLKTDMPVLGLAGCH